MEGYQLPALVSLPQLWRAFARSGGAFATLVVDQCWSCYFVARDYPAGLWIIVVTLVPLGCCCKRTSVNCFVTAQTTEARKLTQSPFTARFESLGKSGAGTCERISLLSFSFKGAAI